MSRALIVEDEALVLMMLEDILGEFDHEIVASFARLEDALPFAQEESFDFAVLDLNLNGKSSLPIAEVLQRRGVPFLFATGYGASPLGEQFTGVPTVTKPYVRNDIAQALEQIGM